ncbi:MAG: sulfatase-like hydrolase/transferase [Acidimicrobiales bacterium]
MTATPNILLIVLDALRQDALADALELPGRCLRAPVCISAAPWTLPSCTSIVTGAPATEHGRYWWSSPRSVGSLVPSLPDRYRTAGFVNNNMLTEGSGIDEGFDSWTYDHDHEEPFRRALRLINKTRSNRPQFLLLHSNISHDYYLPGAAAIHGQVFPEDAVPRMLNHRVISWKDTTAEERESVPRTYEACARRLIERVRVVLEAVRQRDDFVTCITADHGEGLDYVRGRVHHGGRVHQDLVHVPLYFDLPSFLDHRGPWLQEILDRGPVSGTEVLPMLLALAGQRPVEDVPALHDDDAGPVHVAEDRRYLYFRDRFRLNLHGRYKNMSAAEKERNRSLTDDLAEPPASRAYVRRSEKLTVTSLCLAENGSDPSELRDRLLALAAQLPDAPLVALAGNRLFAFSLYDLAADPVEDDNLLSAGPEWKQRLMSDGGWAGSVVVPTGAGPMDLATMLERCEAVS